MNFRRSKKEKKKNQINFQTNISQNYNQLFTMNELQDSLWKAHNTAVGPDEIHYKLLRNLPKISREYLLSIYNDIWTTGNIPKL